MIANCSDEDQTHIPVTLITGFLGSGKTTLLSRLLSHPEMKNTAVIINEFGEIGLDHLLIAKPREDTVLLSNGCLCCSAGGELIEALQSLTEDVRLGKLSGFDRVIIETTGLADPVQVMIPLTTEAGLCESYRLDGVITVVDGLNALYQFGNYHESVDQVSAADQLLISKVDLLNQHEIDVLQRRLEEINPGASVHTMVQGEINPETIFGLNLDRTTATDKNVGDWLQFDRFKHAERSHGSEIQSFSLTHESPISQLGFQLWMDMIGSFRGPNLLRLKGIMNVEGEPVVIQAVQHLFQPPVTLPAWPDHDRRSRIVCITRGVSNEDLEESFEAFSANIDELSVKSLLENESYKRLIAATQRIYSSAGAVDYDGH